MTHRILTALVAVALVPAGALAQTAAKPAYPKATVVKRERLTKGATVTYEIQLKGGPGEVVLTPDGSWVSPKAKSSSHSPRGAQT